MSTTLLKYLPKQLKYMQQVGQCLTKNVRYESQHSMLVKI